MFSKSERLAVAILFLTVLVLLVPPMVAQVESNRGFVAAPTVQAPAESGSEEPVRPVAKSIPPTSKVTPFGNLLIIYFEEPALARYGGDIPGLEATNPVVRGESKLDPKSEASRAYLRFLTQRQDEHVLRIEQRLGRVVEPVFRYKGAANGIAVKMTRAEGKLVEKLPGVVRVIPDSVAYLHTDRGPLFIGADQIWDGTATGGLPGTKGEGQIVGIIDSGVNMDHPSFAATGGDGFTHTNPNGSGNFLGWCDPDNPNYDVSYTCNDKLIGAWDYTDLYCANNPGVCSETDGPEDDNGHGSHTASTAAGNALLSPAISGVALHANLITYDACYTNAQRSGSVPILWHFCRRGPGPSGRRRRHQLFDRWRRHSLGW